MLNQLPIAMGLDPVSWAVIIITVVSSVASVAGALKARAAMKKFQQTDKARQSGTIHQVRASAMPRRLLYGYRRVGGLEAYVAVSGTENEYLHLILIWGDGPCKSIDNLLFNGSNVDLSPIESGSSIQVAADDSPYAGTVRFETSLGDNLLPGPLGADIIPVWGDVETNILKGICYSWVELKYVPEVYPNGCPDISVIMSGRKDIWDPRDEMEKYTDNAALCLSHYMTGKFYGTDRPFGPGLNYDEEIGIDELIAAANICEEEVEVPSEDSGGATEFRYTFSGVIELDRDPDSIIELFRVAMAGITVYIGGKWRIYPGAYYPPTFTIDQSIIVGPVNRKSRESRFNRVNMVKGVYDSVDTNFVAADFPVVKDDAAIVADGGQLPEDMDLLNSASPYRCRRIASIFLKRARLGREITVPCSVEAWRAQVGLPVNFFFPEIGFGEYDSNGDPVPVPMDVLSTGLSIAESRITVSLVLRETSPSVFDDEAQAYVPPHTRPVPLPVPDPTGLRYEDLLTPIDADLVVSEKKRGGNLVLCGFSEFDDPSSPPKKYRNKTVQGGMDVEEFKDGDDCPEDACPGAKQVVATGLTQGASPYLYNVDFTIELVSIVGSTANYVATLNDARTSEDGYLSPIDAAHVKMIVSGAGGGTVFGTGATITFSKPVGEVFNVSLQINYVTWLQIIVQCITAGWPVPFSDNWDLQLAYDDDCIKQVDGGSVRDYAVGANANPIPGVIAVTAGPGTDEPPVRYAPAVDGFLITVQPTYVNTVADQTSRTTTGLGCVVGIGMGPASMQANGEVTEQLSEEYTEADAIERKHEDDPWDDISWDGCDSPCGNTLYQIRGNAEFDFDYFESLIRLQLSNLESGSAFVVKVRLTRIDLVAETTDLSTSIVLSGTADLDGNAVLTFEMPVERGYQHYIRDFQVYGTEA